MPPPSTSAQRQLAGTVLVLATAPATAAQGIGDFHLDSVHGHVRLSGDYWEETRSTGQTLDLETRESALREELLLRLRGSYYHPKLLTYDIEGLFGLEQVDDRVRGPGTDRSLDQQNLGWDARLLFFKDLPYSLDVYSHRNESRSRQAFFRTTEAVVTETGTTLHANEWWIPSQLHYHTFRYTGRGLDTFRETRRNVSLEGSRNDDARQLRYSLEFNDVDLENFGQGFDDYDVELQSNFLLGDLGRDRWVNSFSHREQRGAIDTKNTVFQSMYREQWTEDLHSDHDLRIARSESAAATTQTYSLRSGIGHQLFDSLSSGLSGQLTRTEIGDGTVDDYGASASLNYRKHVPFGILTLNSFTDYYVQDHAGLDASVLVLDEAHVFNLGTPIFLDNPAVDPTTIVVTDSTGLILYAEGVDYLVGLEGNRTRIDIPVGSGIGPGDTILVDYTYSTSPDLRFDSLAQNLALGLTFGDIATLNVSYGFVDQNRISGVDAGTLEDTARFRTSLHVYPFGGDVGVEYENFDSDFAPFERTSLLSAYQFQPTDTLSCRLSGMAFQTSFGNTAAKERGVNTDLGVVYRLARNSRLGLRGSWHRVDLQSDEGEGFTLESSWRHDFKAVELSVELRFSDEDFEVATDQKIVSALVSLTRRF